MSYVLPNLQFGCIEVGICNAHFCGFGFSQIANPNTHCV